MIRFGLAAAAAALMLAGCAHRSVGHPVQQLVDEYGAPAKAIDLPGGRRLFQWWWSDVFVMEEEPEYDGSREWWTTNSRRIHGVPMSRDCATDVIARWDESRGTWMVEKLKHPRRDCGMRR
jgi:hypothetical protein